MEVGPVRTSQAGSSPEVLRYLLTAAAAPLPLLIVP